jgi:gamma-glutamylaminecyclotransferase
MPLRADRTTVSTSRSPVLEEPHNSQGGPPVTTEAGVAGTDELTFDEERVEHQRELRQWYDVLFDGPYELKYPAPPTGPVRMPGRTHPDMARSNPHTRHLLADLDSDLGIGGSLRGTYFSASRQRRKQLYQGNATDAEENHFGGSEGHASRLRTVTAAAANSPARSDISHTSSLQRGMIRENDERYESSASLEQLSWVEPYGRHLNPAQSEPNMARRELAGVPMTPSSLSELDGPAETSATSPASLSTGNLHPWLGARSLGGREPVKHRPHWIFVYGTLKRGWPNHALLRHALYEGGFITIERFPLVIGGPHFTPFLLNRPGAGKNVRGEVYRVDDEELAMLDVLENVGANYHRERTLVHHLHDVDYVVEVFVYLKCNYTEDMLQQECLEEYTDTRYVPRHRRLRE